MVVIVGSGEQLELYCTIYFLSPPILNSICNCYVWFSFFGIFFPHNVHYSKYIYLTFEQKKNHFLTLTSTPHTDLRAEFRYAIYFNLYFYPYIFNEFTAFSFCTMHIIFHDRINDRVPVKPKKPNRRQRTATTTTTKEKTKHFINDRNFRYMLNDFSFDIP